VPVTLKIRTGWCPETRNGTLVARIAEEAGVQLLTVHGRTRADRFKGEAEYDTIAAIKQAVSIPIIANGDIDSPQKAARVISYTRADGVMIGRAAQGNPWLFNETEHYLETGVNKSVTSLPVKAKIIQSHLKKMHSFYGKVKGVWYARKHVAGYVNGLPSAKEFMLRFNASESSQEQLELLEHYFDYLSGQGEGAIAA
jgi:tRNA-dihydrouridine synthase B